MKTNKSKRIKLPGGLAILIAGLLFTALLRAQDGSIAWQNTISGYGQDDHRTFSVAANGGYLIGALSNSGVGLDKTEPCRGDFDYWLIKTDPNGNVRWDKTIGGNGYDNVTAFFQTSDGGYFVAGWSQSGKHGDKTETNKGGSDYWVLKLNEAGKIIWQNTIGGTGTDELYYAVETTDHGYFLAGYSNSEICPDKSENPKSGSFDYWIVKLNQYGQIQWENTIGGNGDDRAYAATPVTGGGYLIAGVSWSDKGAGKTQPSRGGSDYWIVKTDANGNVLWDKTYGGYLDDWLGSVIETSDGNFLLGGNSSSGISGDKTSANYGGEDSWLIKISAEGNIIWQTNVGGNSTDDIPVQGLYENALGNYVISGYTSSTNTGTKSEIAFGSYDTWTNVFSSDGKLVWENAIGGDQNDLSESSGPASDGGYIVCGWSASGINRDKTEVSYGNDIWIFKLNDCIASTPLTADATAFCKGETTTLHAVSNPVNLFTYDWFRNGEPIAPWMGATITPWQSGIYEAYTIVANTCSGYSGGLEIKQYTAGDKKFIVHDIPNLCLNSHPRLSVTGTTDGFNYQWYKDNVPIPGAVDDVYYATETGWYKALVISEYGCGDVFTRDSVEIYYFCREELQSENEQIVIYPNPAADHAVITLNNVEGDYIVAVTTLSGEQIAVFSGNENGTINLNLDTRNLSGGIYLVSVLTEKGISKNMIEILR